MSLMELESLREHYAALPKEPLVVRLDLQTPVVLGPDPLCLDSLLAYRLAVRLFGRGAFDRMGAMLDLPLPLERTGSVWHASIGFPDSAAHVDHDHLSKRWSVGPPAGVKLGTGWSRMYHLAVFPVSTPSLRFYAKGNTQAVKDLLDGLWAVGKHRNKGYGRVRGVEVLSAAEDWSLWREGRPQRPIPVHEVPEPWRHYVAPTGYRPPTWRPENQGLCVLPEPDLWLHLYPVDP